MAPFHPHPPPILSSPAHLLLTCSKAGCVVLYPGQVQVVVPPFQVLVDTVALTALLVVMVAMVTPGKTWAWGREEQ